MRFGIVGTNFVSDFFMEAAAYVPSCEVVSVCSGRKENAVRFAEKYDIKNVYEDYIEMIESGTIDAVYLGVPNGLHHDMTIECLKRKIATFTEKPFATNYREAKEMIECANENKTYVHDGLVPLYTSNFQILKEAMSEIGVIRRAVFNFGKYSSRYDAYLRGENPTTFRRELSNGSTMDIGIYAIGDAVALFGKPKKIIATAQLLETGVDALGTCLFVYDGFEVILLHSKVTDTEIMSEIQGEEGFIQIDLLSRMSHIYLTRRDTSEGCTLAPKQGIKTKISNDNADNFSAQIEDFIQNVEQGKLESEKCPHQLTLDIIEVMTECRRQAGVIYPADEVE